jgi:DNA-binding transcriptional regulator YhcF (GntR family)
MDKPTAIHDNFIRSILADKEIAIDYFRTALPAYILERLDFSTLVQLPDTYISKELRKTISDIVYSCSMKDGSGMIRISLLIEHKSYLDKYTPIQIGSYIFSGLLKQIGNKQKNLSLLIPILLYHGKEKWEYRTLNDLFIDLDPELRGFIPDYEYVYHNLGEISDEAIQVLHNKFLAASLLALKHSVLKSKPEEWMPLILGLADEAGVDLQTSLIIYIFVNSGLKKEEILKIIRMAPVTIKKTAMNTLDYLREEVRQEELEKAVRNLVKQSVLSDQQIASALEVSVKYVVGIRKAQESEK